MTVTEERDAAREVAGTPSPAQRALWAAIGSGRVIGHEPTGNAAIDALITCTHHAGVEVAPTRLRAAVRVRPDTVEHAARALGVAVRPVTLSPSARWWSDGVEPLVVRTADGGCAAVLPAGRRARLVGTDGTEERLGRREAAAIRPEAHALVSVLPDEPAPLRSALRRLALTGSGRDLALLAATGLASALLATLIPIMSGRIVGELVPTDEVGRIVVVTAVLVLAAALGAIVAVATTVAAQRLAARGGIRMRSAAYERLLRLPLSFHRRRLPGSLAGRVAGVDEFTAGVAAALPAVVASSATLLAGLAVLVWVSGPLALAVLGLTVAAVVVTAALSPHLVRDARAYTAQSLRVSGLALSVLGGVSKVKAAAAQQRMLERFTFGFAQQQRAQRDLTSRTIVLGIVAGLPVLVVPMLLITTQLNVAEPVDLAGFTSAASAAAQVAAATGVLLPVAVSLLALTPSLAALAPVLEARPEPRGSAAQDPGTLRGDLALDHVSFDYVDQVPVLHDVSLRVPAGKMVAIVGPSGSGKSTIVRLLLGLEVPEQGTVLYDGRALTSLDRAAVLAQVGVVPQDADLIAGSILDNILASAPWLDEAAAWEAAERAQVAEDIRAMPTGMQTVVSGGAAAFSGGQRQRILIARALAAEPRIVVLDEATSALDNLSQQRVADALAQVGATRVVVAHRLSTIRRADRIVVLDEGRVVAEGSYDELADGDPTFARLVARQRLDS